MSRFVYNILEFLTQLLQTPIFVIGSVPHRSNTTSRNSNHEEAASGPSNVAGTSIRYRDMLKGFSQPFLRFLLTKTEAALSRPESNSETATLIESTMCSWNEMPADQKCKYFDDETPILCRGRAINPEELRHSYYSDYDRPSSSRSIASSSNIELALLHECVAEQIRMPAYDGPSTSKGITNGNILKNSLKEQYKNIAQLLFENNEDPIGKQNEYQSNTLMDCSDIRDGVPSSGNSHDTKKRPLHRPSRKTKELKIETRLFSKRRLRPRKKPAMENSNSARKVVIKDQT